MTEEVVGALQISGTLYQDIYVNGVQQGLKQLPGLVECSITPKSKITPQISKAKETYGQVTATVAAQEPAELKFKFNAFNAKVMAVSMMGDSSALDVAASTATDVAFTAKLDCWVKLGTKNLTANSVVVTNSDATTTYVENVDYKVNYALGMIMALSTGAITEAQSLKGDHANAAYSGFITQGATTPSITAYYLLDGTNLADGEAVTLEIDRAKVSASSAIDFMSDKMSELEVNGFMETLPGATSPFRVTKTQSA